ncbi:cation transporter [Sneathiella marina]|uniref:Cation transporter n=1 Tax=Sneathiella marina TaxID=2950108 RepID=A0ABY4W5S7_9PROT|nr:cation transporter [Sneathiella marina]USG62556.1 cation transporter [Sneathiella marina]
MGDSCCEKQIDVSALKDRQRRVLIQVLLINAATFVMMICAAYFSGSSSLLSGALDNFGDALTYALSLAVVGASIAMKARVALFKGLLIFGAAAAVAVQVAWRVSNVEVPIFETMGVAALLNLGANLLCLRLLYPYRNGDVNMTSVWECSRNDVMEGLAVIAATLAVWAFSSGWPDILIAIALVILFLRSASRVLRSAWRELYPRSAAA